MATTSAAPKTPIWAVTLGTLLMAGLAACQTVPHRSVDQPTMEQIIASLQSDALQEREAAADTLRQLGKGGLSLRDGLLALTAAADEYPPPQSEYDDIPAGLVRAAAQLPRSEYIPVILQHFPDYSSRAKGEALALLTEIDDRAATKAWMQLIRNHVRTGGVPFLATWGFERSPRHADILFPELLDYADIPEFSFDIYLLFLTYLQHDLLSPGQVIPYAQQVVIEYHSYEDPLRASQQSEGTAWIWEDEYQMRRDNAALLLDVMGYLPTAEVQEELRQAVGFEDPRLKHFAVVSLLRTGNTIDPADVRDVAASDEMRNSLYDELAKLGALSLFPEEYATQEAFARSEIVSWLAYPTELGRVPDEIELMKVVEADTKTADGILDYYVFRFRTHEPHWAASDGWMAGVAGPYMRKDGPSTVSYGGTFSAFESWESRTPEGHVGNIQEILDRWRENIQQ